MEDQNTLIAEYAKKGRRVCGEPQLNCHFTESRLHFPLFADDTGIINF